MKKKNEVAKSAGICFDSPVQDEPDEKTNRVAMGLATSWVILRHRPYRRNLLFFTTLVTLLLVFAGAAPLGGWLGTNPVWFAAFWIAVFLLAAFVLLLAVYDLIRVRSDHRKQVRSLAKELAEAEAEARRLAREELAKERRGAE